MTDSVSPLLRRAAACLDGVSPTASSRFFAIVVAVATAIVSSH
jgi:hypothetical protein